MPRNKRRIELVTEDERQFSKRARNHVSSRRIARDNSAFTQRRCVQLFREYTVPTEPDTLGPEGMEKFCADIGVEPENVVMLVLAWKMNARQMGFFTLNEWLRGFVDLQTFLGEGAQVTCTVKVIPPKSTYLCQLCGVYFFQQVKNFIPWLQNRDIVAEKRNARCDTIPKIQAKLDYLKSLLNDYNTFKSIYRYAYDFARDKEQRSMDIETAKAMLKLLLGKHWSLFSQFNSFLESSKYKVINKDQWCNIFEFSRTIVNDLSNYDVDGAWPVMLDEFVEWLTSERQAQPYRS